MVQGSVRDELAFCLLDGVPRVIERVGFVFGTVVSNALNDLLAMIASSQRSLGVGPIRLGLASVPGGHSARWLVGIRKTARRF